MSNKIRVYELAKLLGVSNKELMEILRQLEIEVSTHMSSIDTDQAQKVEDFLKHAAAPSSDDVGGGVAGCGHTAGVHGSGGGGTSPGDAWRSGESPRDGGHDAPGQR